MKAHQLPIQKTAHFYTLGELTRQTRHVYIVLHGYGQLASQIIHKFDALGDDVFVIAPEGLSRFYWDGVKGQVGASWMTKADRIEEIEDYCNYLQKVYSQFEADFPKQARITLLGFSQGGATAMRWALLKEPQRLNRIILWASESPADLPYLDKKEFLESRQLFWVYGTLDPFLNEERIEQLRKRFHHFELNPKIITFEGKHVIDRTLLKKIHIQK